MIGTNNGSKYVARYFIKVFMPGLQLYDTIGEFNVDWKAEYSALSSTRSQKKKLKQPTPVPL